MPFNLENLKKEAVVGNRYEKRLSHLVAERREIERIKVVVETAIENIKAGQKSFVIYGEPQSGKTEMMIALTAKLLDTGHKIVVVLLNDSVQLLGQNLERFQRSGLSPVPRQNSIPAENGTNLPPHSVKSLNSTMVVFEERGTLSVSACTRSVYIYKDG